jgi:excisionase family DNA binding protein
MSDATGRPAPGPPGQQRFLQLAEVADVLNISAAQAYALVRRGDIKAIKIGGRGQWRVETTELEAYIRRLYQETTEFITSHPYGDAESFEEP